MSLMLYFAAIISCSIIHCENNIFGKSQSSKYDENGHKNLFSPRMNYEQWTPLGMGDPLKNDPTFDYVPPILDHVHYWVQPLHPKPHTSTSRTVGSPQKKTEVLLLGVTSKHQSAVNHKHEKKSFVDRPGSSSIYYPPFYKGYILQMKREHPTSAGIPYTLLMPPPIPLKEDTQTTQTPTPTMGTTTHLVGVATVPATSTSKTLIGNESEWASVSDLGGDLAADANNAITWKTLLTNDSDDTKNVTFKDFMDDHRSNNKDLMILGVMHKGQVADEVMDIANSYVNIGKPEAHVDSLSAMGVSGVSLKPPQLSEKSPVIFDPSSLNKSMHTADDVKVITYRPPVTLIALLKKEITQRPDGGALSDRERLAAQPVFLKNEDTVTGTTAKPVDSPMYLIIQGHSKVKTYGPVSTLKGDFYQLQDTNEISKEDPELLHVNQIFRRVVQSDTEQAAKETNRRERQFHYLQTLPQLVQSKLGYINLKKYESPPRMADDVKEQEFLVGYDVSDTATTESYYPGIVEHAR